MNAKYLQMLKNALSLMKKNDELKVSSDERVQELESKSNSLNLTRMFWTIWLFPETR
jgi:hypothetical protein